MADKKFKFSTYDNAHLKRQLERAKAIADMLEKASVRATKTIIASNPNLKPNDEFYFKDHPKIKRQVDEIFNEIRKTISFEIEEGDREEWLRSCKKNDAMIEAITSSSNIPADVMASWKQPNLKALEAFQTRKINGMGLSKRVWQITEQAKEELELALDVGIGAGKSANDLISDVRKYLKNPDALFRRVRDKHGNLRLSKAAKAYHPGRGVYRSAYKNALRLTATETNMAYRTADHLRWQQIPFVIGIEIKLSNNHTCKGVIGRFVDICDDLAGTYPKDFKFAGWHPHCRCFAVPKLADKKDFQEYQNKLLAGENVDDYRFKGEVKDVPSKFKDWLENNRERATKSFSMPYFIKDNSKYLPKGYKKLYGMKTPYDSYAEYHEAMKYNKKHARFSAEQQQNIRVLNEVLPIMRGRIMSFSEADRGRANPDFILPNAKDLGFKHNCQTCTMAFELRRRGFDVEAKSNPLVKGFKKYRDFSRYCAINGMTWDTRFLNADGSKAYYLWSIGKIKGFAFDDKFNFINNATAKPGRYEIYAAWKGKEGGAHVWIIERGKNGEMLWFDPQSGKRAGVFVDFVDKAKSTSIGVMRIDDKLINPKFAERLIKARK